jgi:hypothetical protein
MQTVTETVKETTTLNLYFADHVDEETPVLEHLFKNSTVFVWENSYRGNFDHRITERANALAEGRMTLEQFQIADTIYPSRQNAEGSVSTQMQLSDHAPHSAKRGHSAARNRKASDTPTTDGSTGGTPQQHARRRQTARLFAIPAMRRRERVEESSTEEQNGETSDNNQRSSENT